MLRAVLRRLGRLHEFGKYFEGFATITRYAVLQPPQSMSLGHAITPDRCDTMSFGEARTQCLERLLAYAQHKIAKEIA